MNSVSILLALLSGMAWGSDEWLTLRGALRHARDVQFYCVKLGHSLTLAESEILGLPLAWGG